MESVTDDIAPIVVRDVLYFPFSFNPADFGSGFSKKEKRHLKEREAMEGIR